MFGGKPLLGYAKEAFERKLSQHQADSEEWACAWRGERYDTLELERGSEGPLHSCSQRNLEKQNAP